jgi:hypothetical protein
VAYYKEIGTFSFFVCGLQDIENTMNSVVSSNCKTFGKQRLAAVPADTIHKKLLSSLLRPVYKL